MTIDTTPLVADVVPLVNVADSTNKKVTVGNLTNQINVKQYGALGDGIYISDGAITSGTATFTSATASFTSADIGKRIVIEGAGSSSATLATTISAIGSATSITIGTNASTTVSSNAKAVYGTDDTTAINSAISAASNGDTVFFPVGLYMISSQISIAGAVRLLGTGLDYATAGGPIRKGSVIICAASMTSGVKLGTSLSTSTGLCGASMEHMGVDGMYLATNTVQTGSRRNYIFACQIWRGLTYGLNMTGQNGYCSFSIIGQQGKGTCVLIPEVDNKLYNNQIREGLVASIEITRATPMIQGNHIFTYQTGAGWNIYIHDTQNTDGEINILGNTIEVCTKHQIYIVGKASQTMGRISIIGNTFYEVSGFADNTYSIVALDVTASSTVLNQITVMGNTFSPQGGGKWKGLVEKIGSGGTLRGVTVTGNAGNGVNAFASGFRPESMLGNINEVSGVIKLSDNGGVSTQSGNGSTTAFTIAHGLYDTPNHATVTAGSSAAAAAYYVSWDSTNLTVTFLAAPANGTNNLLLAWRAWL